MLPFVVSRKRVVRLQMPSDRELRWGPRPAIIRTRMRFTPEITALEFADPNDPSQVLSRLVRFAIPNVRGNYFEMPVFVRESEVVPFLFDLLDTSDSENLELTLDQTFHSQWLLFRSVFEVTIFRRPTKNASWAYHFSLMGTEQEPQYRLDTTMAESKVRWQTHPDMGGLCLTEPILGLSAAEELAIVRSGSIPLMRKVYDPVSRQRSPLFLREGSMRV